MAAFDEYANYDGLGLAELVHKKEVTALELLEAAIAQIEAVNPKVNAVIDQFFEEAAGSMEALEPDAPFCGVPFLMKDILTAYAGRPFRSGSRLYRDYVPEHDGEMAVRFKAAGLVVLGKTNAPEFGLMPVTEPELFGATRNPWDLSLTPGGSSGGAAVAVATRMVPIAHGNDGGGSIRVPASCCGVFGLKPTRGRNPIGPDVSEAWQGFASDHVLTRSVRDSAAILDATCGPEIGALNASPRRGGAFLDQVATSPGKLRIAFTTAPLLGHRVHGDCIVGVEETVRLCRNLGHDVIEAAPAIDGMDFARAFMTMVCAETRAQIEGSREITGRSAKAGDVETETWILGLLGKGTSAAALIEAQHRMHRAAREIGRFFENHDVLLTPTLSQPPLKIGSLQQRGIQRVVSKMLTRINSPSLVKLFANIDALADEAFDFVSFTPPFNATGQPAMSIPLHQTSEGIPIGMHFVGRFGDESTLFRLAGQLEEARPWADRSPAL